MSMPRSSPWLVTFVVASLLSALPAFVSAQSTTWTIPDGAAAEPNPVAASPDTMKKGASLYKANCAGCHGPTGLGDGPNADARNRAQRPANLTLSRNPDGVVFYKIWNGRKDPDMPAFKSRMTKDEVWTVVTYVTGALRSASPSSAAP